MLLLDTDRQHRGAGSTPYLSVLCPVQYLSDTNSKNT